MWSGRSVFRNAARRSRNDGSAKSGRERLGQLNPLNATLTHDAVDRRQALEAQRLAIAPPEQSGAALMTQLDKVSVAVLAPHNGAKKPGAARALLP